MSDEKTILQSESIGEFAQESISETRYIHSFLTINGTKVRRMPVEVFTGEFDRPTNYSNSNFADYKD